MLSHRHLSIRSSVLYSFTQRFCLNTSWNITLPPLQTTFVWSKTINRRVHCNIINGLVINRDTQLCYVIETMILSKINPNPHSIDHWPRPPTRETYVCCLIILYIWLSSSNIWELPAILTFWDVCISWIDSFLCSK